MLISQHTSYLPHPQPGRTAAHAAGLTFFFFFPSRGTRRRVSRRRLPAGADVASGPSRPSCVLRAEAGCVPHRSRPCSRHRAACAPLAAVGAHAADSECLPSQATDKLAAALPSAKCLRRRRRSSPTRPPALALEVRSAEAAARPQLVERQLELGAAEARRRGAACGLPLRELQCITSCSDSSRSFLFLSFAARR